MYKCISKVEGPYNQYSYFIGPNPRTTFNKNQKLPLISSSAFIGPFSSVIGDVTIGENVFVACNAVIRADEGSPFYIGKNTNIQDGVILHGLANKYVHVGDKSYSVYIGDDVSCAHGSIVHGPCMVGEGTFVGVKAVIFAAVVKKNCFVATGAVVTNGVVVEDGKFVPPGVVIDTQEKANALGPVPKSSQDLAHEVLEINKEFPSTYSMLFGKYRCSCGLCCDRLR